MKWPLHLHPQGYVFYRSVENHLFVPMQLPRMSQEESKYICRGPQWLNALQISLCCPRELRNFSAFSLTAREWEFGKKAHACNSLITAFMRKQETESRLRQNTCLLLPHLHKRRAPRESNSPNTFELIYSCFPFALDGEIGSLTLGEYCQQTRTVSLCPAAWAPPHDWGAKVGIEMVNKRIHTCRTKPAMARTKQGISLP